MDCHGAGTTLRHTYEWSGVETMTRACMCLLAIVLGTACAATPLLTPAAGKRGPYVHVSGDGQGSLALPPKGWPPTQVAQQGACADESAQLERDLGVTSKACPQFQQLPLAAAAGIADADAEIPTGPSLELRCYELGSAMLVVEYAKTSVQCTHVMGMAVFKQGKEVQ